MPAAKLYATRKQRSGGKDSIGTLVDKKAAQTKSPGKKGK